MMNPEQLKHGPYFEAIAEHYYISIIKHHSPEGTNLEVTVSFYPLLNVLTSNFGETPYNADF